MQKSRIDVIANKITIREYYAGLIAQGLVYNRPNENPQSIAQISFEIADALIERSKS